MPTKRACKKRKPKAHDATEKEILECYQLLSVKYDGLRGELETVRKSIANLRVGLNELRNRPVTYMGPWPAPTTEPYWYRTDGGNYVHGNTVTATCGK